MSRRVRTRQGSSHLLATLAGTERDRGCAKEGLAAIDEALGFVEQTGERFWEAEILRLNMVRTEPGVRLPCGHRCQRLPGRRIG